MPEQVKIDDKKILFFITKSNFGGAQRYVYNLACELEDRAGEVKVVFGGSGVLAERLERENIETISVSYLERDINLIKEFFVLFQLIGIFWREQPDILHLNSSKAGGLGVVAAGICNIGTRLRGLFLRGNHRRINTVFTSHGWAFNEPRSTISRKVIALLYWVIMLFSDTTIAVSYAAKGQVARFLFIQEKDIKVVHNGIRSPELCEREYARETLAGYNQRLWKKYTSSKKELFWIGTISELHPIKGLPVAVDAISELVKENSDIIFVIMGAEGNEEKKIREKIAKNSLEENVFILGFVDHAPSYLNAFDIFTLTSYSECFPYMILEAGFAGLPIVASEVGGIPEAIKEGINGKLVTPGDSQAVVEAVRDLMENNEKRLDLGESLKSRVKRVFSVEKMAEETMKVYKQMLQSSCPQRGEAFRC